MKLKPAPTSLFFLTFLTMAMVETGPVGASASPMFQQNAPPAVELITAEELKTKVARNDSLTIIDVRSTGSYNGSDNRIKGAIHVRLRRLKTRLAFPPLKDIPRDSEIVTYCECPSDESSKRAAQILMDAGFKRVRALKDGWRAWLKAKGPVEPRSRPS